MTFDVIIVGAGLSGTFMSSMLKEKKKNVLVLEKSSGIGGRLSTKPIGSQFVDYGCQYIKPKTAISVHLSNKLENLGLLSEITLDTNKRVFISPFGMNKIPQYFSRNTKVLSNTLVKKISYKKTGWEVFTDSGSFSSLSVVLTMPIVQVETLLRNSAVENVILPKVDYLDFHTCTFTSDKHTIEGVFSKSESFPWICNNSKKGLRNTADAFTANVNKDITQSLKNLSPEQKLEIVKELLSGSGFENIKGLNVHYWRYAFANNQDNTDYFFNKSTGLGVCGDSFSVGKVDGAVKSAELLCIQLLNYLDNNI